MEPPVDDEADNVDDEVPDVVDPTDDDEVIVDEPANNGTAIASQCGVGNAVSCCNTASEGSALSLVLGGSCSLQIPVLAAALGNGCNAGNSFCCPTTQNVRSTPSNCGKLKLTYSNRVTSTLVFLASRSTSKLGLATKTIYGLLYHHDNYSLRSLIYEPFGSMAGAPRMTSSMNSNLCTYC